MSNENKFPLKKMLHPDICMCMCMCINRVFI
jgi:hypothetical protein